MNSSIADAVNAVLSHHPARDVTFVFVSRRHRWRTAGLPARMGWSFP